MFLKPSPLLVPYFTLFLFQDIPSHFGTFYDKVVVILLYADNVFLLFTLGLDLQRLLNMLYEFCISSTFDVNLSKTRIMNLTQQKEIKLRQFI